jgi:hypothetical protein
MTRGLRQACTQVRRRVEARLGSARYWACKRSTEKSAPALWHTNFAYLRPFVQYKDRHLTPQH